MPGHDVDDTLTGGADVSTGQTLDGSAVGSTPDEGLSLEALDALDAAIAAIAS